ncbi:hypothetical protein ACKWTF_015432 [Chironomus riparius]
MKYFQCIIKALCLLSLIKLISASTNWSEINEHCGISHSDRIIGGTTAALGQYPWIAHIGLLRNDNGWFYLSYECGAALIHPKFVITAAHCVADLNDDEKVATIKLGEHNLETKIDCEGQHCGDEPQVIYPLRIILPTEYDNASMKHDIALIELVEAVKMTRYVDTVCLPSKEMVGDDLIGKKVEIAGWGYYDIDDPKTSPVLQVIRLPVVNLDECRNVKQLSQFYMGPGQLCVGGIAGKDSCNGDSGGPLVKAMPLGDYGPRYVLFGIVSVGVPSCGKFSLPAVYTNVSYYLPWIYDNIN